MEPHQDVALLKESFLEFITKVSPVLNEAILEQFNTKWIPFKKLLSDPSKNASDIFIFVSSMSSLKKSNASSTSTNSPFSESSSNQKVESETKQIKTEPADQRECTKVKEYASPLHCKELRIEINKNFFLTTPKSGPPSQQDLNNLKGKNYEHDIKTRILRDDIKFLNELRNATPRKKQSFTERCQISVKISEAVSQFRKNNNTLKTIHERSFEVNTPQSPKQGRSESPLLVVHRPNTNNYFFNPITYQINQQGALKGYSIYSKKIIQPMQFDTQFQMMIQQYQNKIIYKKLYF